MGHFVDAVEIALISIMFPVLKTDWKVGNTELATLAAFTSGGMIIGAVLLGSLSDTIGRRPVFQLSLFVGSLCGFLSAFAPNMTYFVLARALLGVGYGYVRGTRRAPRAAPAVTGAATNARPAATSSST